MCYDKYFRTIFLFLGQKSFYRIGPCCCQSSAFSKESVSLQIGDNYGQLQLCSNLTNLVSQTNDSRRKVHKQTSGERNDEFDTRIKEQKRSKWVQP